MPTPSNANESVSFDFTDAVSYNQPPSFRVRLDASPLARLLEDAGRENRVYELLLISRPGDLLDYVGVIPEAVSPWLENRIVEVRECIQPLRDGQHPWPNDAIPLGGFDRILEWGSSSWDEQPEVEQWRAESSEQAIRCYLDALFTEVRDLQETLKQTSLLASPMIRAMERHQHPLDYLQRSQAIARCHPEGKHSALYSSGFYDKVRQLIGKESIQSVGVFGYLRDWETLRILATEQMRRLARADAMQSGPMNISVFGDWEYHSLIDGMIAFHGESFRQAQAADLILWCSDNSPPESISRIWHQARYCRGNILVPRDVGDLDDFDKEVGGDWCLYQRRVSNAPE